MEIAKGPLLSFEYGSLLFKGKTNLVVQPYDNKFVYLNDEIRVCRFTQLNDLIQEAKKIVKDSLDMTYVVIADQGDCLYLDLGTRLCPTTTFSYSCNQVVYSIAKIEGEIVEGFIHSSRAEEESERNPAFALF